MISTGKRPVFGLRNLLGETIIENVQRAFSGYEVTHCFNGKATIIVDWTGKILRTVPGVESFARVSEGMLSVRDLKSEQDGYISIDTTQFPDLNCKYRIARSFVRGLAAVEIYIGKYKTAKGVIDKTGAFVIPPIYRAIGDFTDPCDVAPFTPIEDKSDDKVWGLINRTGEVVVPPSWSSVGGSFSEGRLVVHSARDEVTGGWGLVDCTGHWTLLPSWDELSGHVHEGSLGACTKSRWGIIDLDGNWFIDPRFDHCAAFHEGLSRTKIKNSSGGLKTGFIDVSGNWIIEPKYDDSEHFRHGLAKVEIYNEQTDRFRNCYVDKEGKEYWQDT